MRQLKMIRKSAPAPAVVLPEGYRIELFTGTQQEVDDWLVIVADGLIRVDGESDFTRSIRNFGGLVPETDLFFVVDPNGKRVATTAAVVRTSGEGYIHMVGSLQEARGKGIGRAMLAYGLASLEARGVPYTYLTTDDHRLPAIKGYLDGGFQPVLREDPDSNIRERWEAVLEKLNYGKVEFLSE